MNEHGRTRMAVLLSGVSVLAAAVAVALTIVGPSQAAIGGPVCNVPTDYPTISAAVADPGCTTVNVAAGFYNEQVQITHTLTLNGANAGADANGPRGPESIISNSCGPVQIMADNVKIDGFTIQDSTQSDPCFIAGIWTNPGYSGTHGGHTIVNNIIQNNISGIELDSDCTYPTLVQHNLIRNNNNPGRGSGNGIETNFGLCNATIDSNTFSGHTSSSFVNEAPSSNLNITNNSLVAGTPEGFALFDVNSSNITGNTSLGSTSSATVDLGGGDSNVAVDGNTLQNGMTAIKVENPYSVGPNSNVTANQNNFGGNSQFGVDVESGGYSGGNLDATCNWWGSITGPGPVGPGTGDRVTTGVNFTPWLTAPAPNGACNGPETQKQCKDNLDQQKKDFDAEEKAEKQAFDSQQHTKAEKKAFEDEEKAEKDAFDDQQKDAKKQCDSLPKK